MARAGRWLISGILLAIVSAAAATAADAPLTVRAVPWGPSVAEADAARGAVLSSAAVKRLLGKADAAVVSFTLLESPSVPGKPAIPPSRYLAQVFDYSNNRAYEVQGTIRGAAARLDIRETAVQPEPDDAERDRAIAIIRQDAKLGPAVRDGLLVPYRPMPPLVDGDLPVGAKNRTVAIGLKPTSAAVQHEIVGVDMIDRAVVRYPERAPQTARAALLACGPNDAGQPTTSRGTAGQVQITIQKGTDTIWSFLAIRPAASSGTRASGLELRDVFYHGKKVLARAHVPILNVHYDGDACGPYRDWQYQEGQFAAHGRDILGSCTTSGCSGVRAARSKPETMVEDGTDNGNFRGFAYFVDGQSVTLESEMEAGWYRYISIWTFDADGSIHPRFGFDGVNNSCICAVHHHNAYWRFDFDIATAANNQIYQVNSGTPTLQTAEARQLRTAGRTWQIKNSATGEGYAIIPGAHDGTADSYGRGDVWLLLAKSSGGTPTELDDGVNITTGANTFIMMDNFVGPEALTATSDVVFWYGGHFDHDVNNDDEDAHIVGPDLVPINW